jgi:CubicO group peptidase (beta-lactamase class C family)
LARAQSIEDLETIVPALMRQYDVPGVALTAVRNDGIEFLRGFGLARLSDSVPVDPERTVFRIASVAKLFVAAAALILVDRGTLDLEEEIGRYVPDLPIDDRFAEPITLHHLLTHTAGLDERMIGYAATSRNHIRPLGEYLTENLPRRGWRPGEVTGYSNHGMALAAHVVERVSGFPFSAFVQDSLFARLAMTNTSYLDVAVARREDRAAGHSCGGDGCSAVDEVYSHPYPVGLAYSTAADMARFLVALLNDGGIDGEVGLPAEVVALLQAEQFTHDPAVPGMSYGFLNQAERGWRALAHAGGVPGMRSLLLIVPEAGVGIFFVANGGKEGFGSALKDSLLVRLLDDRSDVARIAPVRLSPEYVSRFAGPYQVTRYAHYTVEKFPALFATSIRLRSTERATLVLHMESRTEFVPIDSLRFRELDGERVVAFRLDDSGRVSHMFAPLPFFGADFPAAFERRRWYDDARFKNEYVSYLLGVPLIVMLIAWPLTAAGGAWWEKRRRGALLPTVAGSRVGIAMALLFSVLFALFGFGFVARSNAMLQSATGITTGMTPGMRALLQLPYVLALLAALLVVFAAVAWRRCYWGPVRRTYYTLIAALAILVVAFLVRWNYLPPVWR